MNTNELRACPLECRTDPVLCSDGHKVFCPLCGFSAPINSWNRRAAVEALFADAVKDAERYRFIRDNPPPWLKHEGDKAPGFSEELDAACDSMIARSAVSPEVTK